MLFSYRYGKSTEIFVRFKPAEHQLDHFERLTKSLSGLQDAAKVRSTPGDRGPPWSRRLQLIAGAPRRSAAQRLPSMTAS